jgi:hypothetical protein
MVVFYRNLGHVSTFNDVRKTEEICRRRVRSRRLSYGKTVTTEGIESIRAALWRLQDDFRGV